MTDALQQLFAVGRDVIPTLEEIRRQGRTLNQAGGAVIEELDLAAISTDLGQRIDRGGYGVFYVPRGSAQGGLLRLNVGGEIKDFGPGDKLTGPFEWLGYARHASSAVIGKARLMIFTSPWVDFAGGAAAILAAPVDLLGTSGASPAFITVAEDTDPAGQTPTGAFDCSGWQQIRVLIDTLSAAANATSFDLVPWSSPNSDSLWFEQGSERVSVPDTDTTGGRYRVVVFNVSGRGQMYFAVRNLLAAGRTGLGFIVQGIK